MDIQVEKEQKSPVEFDLKITVPAAEMRERVESGLSMVAKRASIPGFRKGKVPKKVLIQRFGEAVTQETVQQVLQDSYRQALTESKIDPVAPGEMSEIHFDSGEPLTYKVSVEILPEFELPNLAEVSVQMLQPSANDEDIDQAIEGMRESSAVLSPTDDPVDEHSVIVIDLQELDETGVPVIGRSQKDVQIDMSRQLFGEDFALKTKGLKCEDKARFEVTGGEDAQGKPKKIRFEATVRNIQRKELPELDEHFVQSVNPNLSGVEELRSDMKKYLDARANYSARQRLYREVADELLKRVDFPVPPRMLDDYLERLAEDGVKSSGSDGTEEKRKEFKENYRTAAIWNLRWYMLRNRVIREKDLKVSKEDTRKEIERLSLLDGLSPEEYEYRLTDDQKQGIRDDLLERKVFEFITNEVQTVVKPVTLAEFEGRADGHVHTV